MQAITKTSETPLISIIIPAFNRETLIAETLDSVIKQTYTNWECIVVDDGSTDNTVKIIKKYATKDSRFKILKRDRIPKGATTCRNIGIEKSTGEFLMFLDSDDIITENCLNQRIKAASIEQQYDLVITQTIVKSDTDSTEFAPLKNLNRDTIIDQFLKFHSCWSNGGTLIKKKFLIDNKLNYNTNLTRWQDTAFNLSILLKQPNYKICSELPADYIYINHGSVDRITRNSGKDFYKNRIVFYEQFLYEKFNREQRRLFAQFYFHAYLNHTLITKDYQRLIKSHLKTGRLLKYNLLKLLFHFGFLYYILLHIRTKKKYPTFKKPFAQIYNEPNY